MRASTRSESQHGAAPSDWTCFSAALGLTADLLPVVSNPNAAISPKSSLKTLGKVPSQYNGDGKVTGFKDWTRHKATMRDIEAWSKVPDYGICIQTRRARALDGDITDANLSKEIKQYITDFFTARGLGHPPVRLRGDSPKFLIAFTLSGQFGKRVIKTAHGNIEFLADGQQFIAAGTHPSGDRYTWDFGDARTFPALADSRFEDLWQGLDAAFGIEPANSSPATVRRREDDLGLADDLADWLYAKGHVLATQPDRSLVIDCPWADEHTTGEAGDTSTVYFPAGTGGYELGHFKCLHSHCAGEDRDRDFRVKIGYYNGDFEPVAEDVPSDDPAGLRRSPLDFIPAAQFAVEDKVEWCVKGVIPKEALGAIYGASGSGKSFFLLDMACAIARGLPWRDRKVTQASVAYVCAEGSRGFKKRLRAYAKHHGVDLSDLPVFVLGMAPNFMDPATIQRLIVSLRKIPNLGWVIVDTYAQVLPGDENSGKDAGAVLRHCGAIMRALGVGVQLVHHTGKDESRGARGWSGFKAALDVEIEVVRENELRTASISKMKDGEDNINFRFRLEPVVLGMDEDGEVISSCVVGHLDTTTGRRVARRGLRINERLAIRVLEEAEGEGVTLDALVAEMVPEMRFTEGARDERKRRAERTVDTLVTDGFVVVKNACYFLQVES